MAELAVMGAMARNKMTVMVNQVITTTKMAETGAMGEMAEATIMVILAVIATQIRHLKYQLIHVQDATWVQYQPLAEMHTQG